MMNVNLRIKQLMKERQWTEYRLQKKADLPASTISNIFYRGSIPTIDTLESICAAFGISLSQFFAEDNFVGLTEEQQSLLEKWALLSEQQKQALLDLMTKMN